MSRHISLLQAALVYAKRGLPVLPLHAPDAGRECSCGKGKCPSPGKHPRTAHGLKDATVDLVTINSWWSTWPTANIGIATGKASGLVALDIDPRHGGE